MNIANVLILLGGVILLVGAFTSIKTRKPGESGLSANLAAFVGGFLIAGSFLWNFS